MRTANCDELAANASRPIFIVGVGCSFYLKKMSLPPPKRVQFFEAAL
ncbi:MAG: hypothetical protein ACJATS_002298, partial [Psychroserpens sp.]